MINDLIATLRKRAESQAIWETVLEKPNLQALLKHVHVTKATTCFIDVDGVVCDLHVPLCQIHGFDLAKWPAGEDDVSKVFGKKPVEVWGHPAVLGREFWESLPLTPWAEQLVGVLSSRFGRENLCFLTIPVRDPDSLSGKATWFRDNFPSIKFLIGPTKKYCAGPDRILIDDRAKNVEEFREHGGKAILFPRIWNALHGIEDPIAYVERELVLLP